jgi:transcriptional regulator with XRE-family HTH domain
MTTTVPQWTGLEAKALRAALRMTMHEFAGYLGVAARTVAKWETGGSDIQPMSQTQAILDTALAKASSDVQARFTAAVSDSLANRSTAVDSVSNLSVSNLSVSKPGTEGLKWAL